MSVPSSGLGPPTRTPLPQWVCFNCPPPHPEPRRGAEGVGGPNSDDWRKSLALCLHCTPEYAERIGNVVFLLGKGGGGKGGHWQLQTTRLMYVQILDASTVSTVIPHRPTNSLPSPHTPSPLPKSLDDWLRPLPYSLLESRVNIFALKTRVNAVFFHEKKPEWQIF